MINYPTVTPLKKKGMIGSPGFLSRFQQPVKVNFKFDVPYLSGISNDASTVYIDKNLRRRLKTKDVVQFLIIYQKAKKSLLDLNPGLHPQIAHEIATYDFEAKAVEFSGLTWDEYEKFMVPQIRDAMKVKNIPMDLDLTHLSENDVKILKKKMRKEEKTDDKTVRQGRVPKLRHSKTATELKPVGMGRVRNRT